MTTSLSSDPDRVDVIFPLVDAVYGEQIFLVCDLARRSYWERS